MNCAHTHIPVGAGESGKSTILKQMRLIHSKSFTPQERQQWKVTIFSNLLHAFQCIQDAMDEHEVDLEESENIVRLLDRRSILRRLMLFRNTWN